MQALSRLALFVALGGTIGCGSIVGDTCDRLEECRALGRGVSTGRCEEIFNDALNELTDAERELQEAYLNLCVDERASCNAFLACVNGEG